MTNPDQAQIDHKEARAHQSSLATATRPEVQIFFNDGLDLELTKMFGQTQMEKVAAHYGLGRGNDAGKVKEIPNKASVAPTPTKPSVKTTSKSMSRSRFMAGLNQ